MDPRYEAQVGLLVRLIPEVAKSDVFALKGGTAINLFHLDMPRLSVDIDLTFLPVLGRPESIEGIRAGLDQVSGNIKGSLGGEIHVEQIKGGGAEDTRLLVRGAGGTVKIETSPVMRGTIHDPELRSVTAPVEDRFGFAEMMVVDERDLFAGKMVATFDRQHPRDIFDMMHYRAGQDISDELLDTFLAYACFSGRPLHEVLFPHEHDITGAYDAEFTGMTDEVVSLEALVEARTSLFREVQERLDDARIAALRSVVSLQPDLSPIGLERAQDLPAFRWKIINLERLRDKDPARFADQLRLLDEGLDRRAESRSGPS